MFLRCKHHVETVCTLPDPRYFQPKLVCALFIVEYILASAAARFAATGCRRGSGLNGVLIGGVEKLLSNPGSQTGLFVAMANRHHVRPTTCFNNQQVPQA
jgi:hypothetical protein